MRLIDDRTFVRYPHIPFPGNEAFVILGAVDREVSFIIADVRHQKMNDIVFADGKSNIDLVPIGPMAGRPENELAADDGLPARGSGVPELA